MFMVKSYLDADTSSFATVSTDLFLPSAVYGLFARGEAYWNTSSLESTTRSNANGLSISIVYPGTTWGSYYGYTLRCVYP